MYQLLSMLWYDIRHTSKSLHGFTLLEVVIMIIVFSAGMVGVFSVLRQGTQFSDRTRLEVIGINLSREWVEWVMNIRDTNRLRRAGSKETCRLKANPLVDEAGEGCSDDARIRTGSYVLQTIPNGSNYYRAVSGPSLSALDVRDNIDTSDLVFSLCQSSWARNACPWSQPISREWQFFRQIDVKWLYTKNTTTPGGDLLSCINGQSPGCGGPEAKELRYCSNVQYQGRGFGNIELCMILTNFAE